MAIFQRAWPGSERPNRAPHPLRGAGRRGPARHGRSGRDLAPEVGLPPVIGAAQDVATTEETRSDTARTLIWSLESGGWSEREAGNLVALLNGLRPALTGWSGREIEHLRFLRVLADTGRLDH